MNITLIGAGNVATHLGQALSCAEHSIGQVYSRTAEAARTLANALGCDATDNLSEVRAGADVYLFCLADAVLGKVADELLKCLKAKDEGRCDALFLHTAGSLPLTVLPSSRRGVFYPMQTFSKQREVDFRQIPIFFESDSDDELLQELARSITDRVFRLQSDQRKLLHLSAVFACNFANYMYDLSAQVLAKADIPFDVMLPLIDETANKVHTLPPQAAQTGPAVRADRNVMAMHESLLADDDAKLAIYQLISKCITQSHAND